MIAQRASDDENEVENRLHKWIAEGAVNSRIISIVVNNILIF